jgi:hypothetical protein
MALKPYTNIYGKYFDSKKRAESIPLQKKALAEGTLEPLDKMPCRMCGQTKGMKAYHCEDYNDPVGDATCLCWRCHMMWHSRFRAPQAVFKYVYEVTVLGKQYPPVHKFDFSVLNKDHGVK